MIDRSQRARFCNETCRDSLREDRRAGAIHPAIHVKDEEGNPVGAYSVERFSLVACCCAYCGSAVKGRAKDLPPNWPAKVDAQPQMA